MAWALFRSVCARSYPIPAQSKKCVCVCVYLLVPSNARGSDKALRRYREERARKLNNASKARVVYGYRCNLDAIHLRQRPYPLFFSSHVKAACPPKSCLEPRRSRRACWKLGTGRRFGQARAKNGESMVAKSQISSYFSDLLRL